MQSDPDLLALAHSVLGRNRAKTRDTAWDSRGTVAEMVSQAGVSAGTAKTQQIQHETPTVPLSHALGSGTVGHRENGGTPLGTAARQHYTETLAALRSRCPDLVESDRWQAAIGDAEAFLSMWGQQANAVGWTARELFGLYKVPPRPAPSYSRLSRYDELGLIWCLHGRPVVALTDTDAAIHGASSAVIYRKHNKPAFGPVGDSLDDIGGGLMADRATLAEPMTVAEWWKNRRGESIRVSLSTYEGHNIADVRTWFTEAGRLKPGKGFAADFRPDFLRNKNDDNNRT